MYWISTTTYAHYLEVVRATKPASELAEGFVKTKPAIGVLDVVRKLINHNIVLLELMD